MSKLSRRTFLQATAAVSALPTSLLAQKSHPHAAAAKPYPENGTLIPDDGWSLWLDREAKWAEDDIFLPEDVAWNDGALCGKGKPLAVNAPTGGWAALQSGAGKTIVLPSSVEQHFWGTAGVGPNGTARPYTPEEYRYASPDPGKPVASPADDDVPLNGAYFGVSWWSRKIDIPASMQGKRIFLHVRGAHLRAEVYLNGKLCGYSIMEELPFEADLTAAANPGGENMLAIRITNPFGRYDWVDGLNAKWGKVSLYRSHGFGALDRGITISAHAAPYRITDAYVLNAPEPNTIMAHVRIDDWRPEHGAVAITVEVVDPGTGKVLDQNDGAFPPTKDFDRSLPVKFRLKTPQAKVWSLDTPALYHLRVGLRHAQSVSDSATAFVSDQDRSKPPADTRTIAFGFRSFTVEGVDPANPQSNALFRLNGKRTKLYTSISWGFWGLNGMFPVPELAEKEVRAAQALGLNCLNFHRNLAKEDVVRWHDKLGVLRYMEPGAGKMAIGKLPPRTAANAASIVMEKPTKPEDVFAQRYMFVKCVEMVKAFRSHPSVFEYCLQNELGADLKNPATLAVLEAMHKEDPSRCVVLNDGFVAPPRSAAQAWYAPWSFDAAGELVEGKLYRSDETPFGAWWNNHQGAGDQWYDEFYKSPTQYTYNIGLRNILTEYGEMEGCARADVHGLNVHQIRETYKKYGGISYDLRDHEEVIAGYDSFLTKWGFRKAFPAADNVFLAVGKTCYESWQNYMENARINDALDFAAISGWESTSIENHSGIVDNLRNFKADPKLIGDTLLPVRPCAKQRSLCVETGQRAVFDLYLFNDTSKPVTGTLTFSMVTPSGKLVKLKSLSCPAQTADQFSYLLQEAQATPALTEEGLYRFKFALSSAPLATQTKEIWVTAAPPVMFVGPLKSAAVAGGRGFRSEVRGLRIGVSGITPSLRKQLSQLITKNSQFPGTVEDFKPGEAYDLIVSSGITSAAKGDGAVGETTGESMPVIKPGHTPEPGEVPVPTQLGHLQRGILEAVQAGTPLLAMPQANTLADGVAKQLAAAGAFTYAGAVGDFRAPWMGNWYFVREHALFDGMPVHAALGGFYQVKGRQSNGLLVDGPHVEVVVAYSRDHDRKVGAGTFTTQLGKGKVLFHRCPDFHSVLQARFLANAISALTLSPHIFDAIR